LIVTFFVTVLCREYKSAAERHTSTVLQPLSVLDVGLFGNPSYELPDLVGAKFQCPLVTVDGNWCYSFPEQCCLHQLHTVWLRETCI